MKRILLILLATVTALAAFPAKKQQFPPAYAWRMMQPLGLREPAPVDTLFEGYAQRSVPSAVSDAWACTGNLGGSGMNMIWMDRPAMGDFFFSDAVAAWLPSPSKQLFFNSRVPMTLLGYNTGGGRENSQDRLSTVFSGNINAEAQIGAFLDYLYSKGSYNRQAAKDLAWGFSGSYIGPRYQMQAYFYHYNLMGQQNGGIEDPLYITDPAVVQGGVTKVDAKAIPVLLNHAVARYKGTRFTMNHRYAVGFWRDLPMQETDTVQRREYVPVTSFIYTLDYSDHSHQFKDNDPAETAEYFGNAYIDSKITDGRTTMSTLDNILGVSLLEGFNRYAKFGLAAYLKYRINRYRQTPDTITGTGRDDLTPWPDGIGSIAAKHNENLAYAGAQITKQQGSILTYEATGEIGITGRVSGDVRLDGTVRTRIPLRNDSLQVRLNGSFHNVAPSYFLNNYLSNHFIWHNDFGKQRTLRFGGAIDYSRTDTHLEIQAANVQNQIYFNQAYLPTQHGGSVQIFSARLRQNLRLGILHWDNRVTYQTTSDEHIIPLPKLAVYSNLYLKFKIATLSVQLGMDCDYYTKYYAPQYQPATSVFANQHSVQLGNYPFMNAYANFKLSKTRFYVMMSHVNQGWFSKDYFALPGYPLNPRRFQIGLSIDFAN